MRITTTKHMPTNEELIEVLKNEFSNSCFYEVFGIGERKTILVKKTSLVGAQISIGENEITIQETPSVLPGNFLFFLIWIGIDTVLGLIAGSKVKKIEKELTGFLKHKFN